MLARNQESENEIKNTFIHSSIKKDKIGIKFSEKVQDLYAKNYRTLLVEIKEDQNKKRGSACS